MKASNPQWIAQLTDSLKKGPLATGGDARRLIREALGDRAFSKALAEWPWRGDNVCRGALAACAPVMALICDEPEKGWLAAIYDHCCAGLFPLETPVELPESRLVAMDFYLATLTAAIAHEMTLRPYDPLTDILFATQEERLQSRVCEEYARFEQAVRASHFIETMHLGRETMPFDPLSHTAGVHHVSVHMARQIVRNGVPVDIALVSAAAASHDIGKFGCRDADAKRIPYLHYYFTDQWLLKHDLPQIAHIAANHSTWDLEFENLPIESLLLIYADFRVRGTRDDAGGEVMGIQTLPDSGKVIFGKLADMDAKKRRRYSRVYHKLCDFEDYCKHLSVNPDPDSDAPLPVTDLDPALQSDAEAAKTLTRLAVSYNIRLMHSVSESAPFERLLERARSEKNLESIRTYLNLFEEYFTYMDRAHKLQLLNFLYELLMHHQSDVRRQAGRLLGRILANSGLQYRKELPENAPETAIAPTLSEMLGQCAALWASMLERLLHPDPKMSASHAVRVRNSLKVVVESLFASCTHMDERMYLDPYLHAFSSVEVADRFVLCDSVSHVPARLFAKSELAMLTAFAVPLLSQGAAHMQVCALRALTHLARSRVDDMRPLLKEPLAQLRFAPSGTAAYLAADLRALLLGDQNAGAEATSPAVASELFLDNLKSAVHWIVKVANIDRLRVYAGLHPGDAFHVATHLSNLLLISEHLPVRERAGQALSDLAPLLSVDQCNEIVIDLCRGIESGASEFSRYVTPCLAKLIGQLPANEQDETVSLLERMLRSSDARAASAALATLAAMLAALTIDGDELDALLRARRARIVGLLMAGLAHFDDAVHRAAFTALCRDVFSVRSIPLPRRRELFCAINKKGLTILMERQATDITFFNTAAMLNHLYRMLIDCDVLCGPLTFPKPGAVAFFPGTFDPFSTGHKRIVTEIRALGVEVYLAVDEFSWSKRTQPKLLRRQIALMSVADCAGVYLFPDDIPVNIANPADLLRLRGIFHGRQLYLVAGSDVIENASAYANPDDLGSACYFDHILFARSRAEHALEKPPALERLRAQVVELTLPTFYEDVSSTRIREFIDKNLEISMMVDPIVASFIHDNGLYLRAPQYKRTLQPSEQTVLPLREADVSTVHVLSKLPKAFADDVVDALRGGSGLAVLFLDGENAIASGAIYGHTVNAAGLLCALGSVARAEYVRMHTSGRILCIDHACVLPDGDMESSVSELVNELLTESLSDGHTYALYRAQGEDDPLADILLRKGFLPIDGQEERVYLVDMRAPLVMTCDAFMMLKEPFASDPTVVSTVLSARKKLLDALCGLFPGTLVLAYDTARINRALIRKVQRYNGVLGLPATPRRLGPFMCVPYGKIMSDVVVPNTVTKTLHVEKVFAPDIKRFDITEDRCYSPLTSQLATIRSFDRPVLLVDDLLHNGYRLAKLDPLFKREGLTIQKILVGILSGRGKDLMEVQQRDVDAVYWVPNLRYWFDEALLYPFIGGDSVQAGGGAMSALPSINLILPYKSPDFIHGASADAKRALCLTALRNAYEILHTLEQRHQALFTRSLTLSRLGEALQCPRLPDKGRNARYDGSVSASSYLLDDIEWMQRLGEDVWNR